MSKYRNQLPQLGDRIFLTDGGIETTLIYHDRLDLPYFAAFHLLQTSQGEAALRRYFQTYAEIAAHFHCGLILESPTWRASADWARRLNYTDEELARANRQAIDLLETVRDAFQTPRTPIVISGCLGPRGDGYSPENLMSSQEAATYHSAQIDTFATTAADMVCAITMNYVEEAIGITQAAEQANMPVAISFTVETDGCLPTGQTLRGAIEQVDKETRGYPSYFMINCAHPSHFDAVLGDFEGGLARIKGLRANASRKSHAELDAATELDSGDPHELARQYAELVQRHPQLNVLGGCCGTDHRHIEEIAKACLPTQRLAS
ncbi:homocysteine S-methyltransferase [Modicisalibacter xianhensis]|uniref:Homocysteine S-methyltransferase n=1 Tax=Modicisalibacter xianhensis TaxID=442341 RepID=A0A4R8FPC5_9GAMM|nr:homocysteine S-methyltransferase family protein [Halomonas xianhensis]TDX28170.1 homocysteine S-methyltransferase [Halomonas xianhensis]